MDFDLAINAHIEWKTRLLRYIECPDHSLKPAIVASDKLCQLGKWIQAQEGTYGRLPEYQRLVCDHTVFHQHAGQIVDKANRGEQVSERDITHPDCAYAIASRNVVHSIMAIRRKTSLDHADDLYLDPIERHPSDQDAAMQKFLYKLAESSPKVLELIEKTASVETVEIIKLIGTYNSSYTISSAMANLLLDSIKNACTGMMMELADICKKKGR